MTSAAPPCSLPGNVSAASGALKFRDMILSKFAQNHQNSEKNNAVALMAQESKITEENHSAQLVLFFPFLKNWFIAFYEFLIGD